MKKTDTFHTLIRAVLSLVLTVCIVGGFLFVVTFIFYTLNPTCEGLIGSEQWTCKDFNEYLFDASTMIIWTLLAPIISMCLFPILWIIIKARQEYPLYSHTKVFQEIRKKIFPLGFAFFVSLVISYLIITLYFYLGGPFSPLVVILWPICYYFVYKFFLTKIK